MNLITSFTLSLQKQTQTIFNAMEIIRTFQELSFRSLLRHSGITKKQGICDDIIDVSIRFASLIQWRRANYDYHG